MADVSSRGKDFGATPLENFYPLTYTHANILNSILTMNFIYELERWQQLFVNLILVLIICITAIKFRAQGFTALTVSVFILFVVVLPHV